MTIDLTAARAKVEARIMSATVTVARPVRDEDATLDRATGELTVAAPAGPIYTGPAHVGAGSVQEIVEGGKTVNRMAYRLSIPWATPDVELPHRGDLVTVTTARDAWLVGKVLRVLGAPTAGDLTVTKHANVVDTADDVPSETRLP